MLPLRSNISVVQSIVLDRRLLELELGRLVTDNMACLFNFLFCDGNVSYYKSLPTDAFIMCLVSVARLRLYSQEKEDEGQTGRLKVFNLFVGAAFYCLICNKSK